MTDNKIVCEGLVTDLKQVADGKVTILVTKEADIPDISFFTRSYDGTPQFENLKKGKKYELTYYKQEKDGKEYFNLVNAVEVLGNYQEATKNTQRVTARINGLVDKGTFFLIEIDNMTISDFEKTPLLYGKVYDLEYITVQKGDKVYYNLKSATQLLDSVVTNTDGVSNTNYVESTKHKPDNVDKDTKIGRMSLVKSGIDFLNLKYKNKSFDENIDLQQDLIDWVFKMERECINRKVE